LSKPKLEIVTPSEREVVITRRFSAPRQAVFAAWTEPELYVRWCVPRGWSVVVCDIDLRVGGSFQLISRQPSGRRVGQRGVFLEVVAPERVVRTELWDDWNPGETLVMLELLQDGAGTLLRHTMRFPSRQVRDMLLASGLTDGSAETFELLDELLGPHSAPSSAQIFG
jgi:uncharacterized protein YndB with AHSA1/START domain